MSAASAPTSSTTGMCLWMRCHALVRTSLFTAVMSRSTARQTKTISHLRDPRRTALPRHGLRFQATTTRVSRLSPYGSSSPSNPEQWVAGRRHTGRSRWCRDLGALRLMGIDTALLGSVLPEEEQQNQFFGAVARESLRPAGDAFPASTAVRK